MTYPQQYGQPYGQQPAYPAAPAQQGYPAPQRPAYPPAYSQPAAPAAPQGSGVVPPMPNVRDGGGGGGAAAPKMRHLQGRTIIVEPVRMQRGRNPETNQEVDEAVFHLTVVDGGPLQYGDNVGRDIAKRRPNTHEIATPCRFVGVTDMGFGFVQAVREALDAGEVARIGVVQQGSKGNLPYLITKTAVDVNGNDRPDGQARYDAAMAEFSKIWTAKHGGAPLAYPEPRALLAPPVAAGPQVNYGQPQGYPAAPQPPAYAPAGAYAPNAYTYGQQPAQVPQPPAYGGIPQQPYAAPVSAPAAPAQPAAPATAPGVASNGYYMPGQGAYAAPAAPAQPEPAAPAGGALPPAMEAWLASLPEDQRAIQRAALLAAQPQPVAAPVPPQGGPGF